MNDSPAPGKPLKRFLSCWAVGFCCLYFSYSQQNCFSSGARSAGLSNSSVALRDGWSCVNNQAGLAYITATTVSFYFENKYQLRELAQRDAFVDIPVHSGTIAFTMRYFGFSDYYETKYGLGYGLKIFPNLAIGSQVNLMQTYIDDGYGKHSAIAAEAGILFSPVNKLSLGFHFFNPSISKHANYSDSHVPVILQFGMVYTLVAQTVFVLEWESWFGHSRQFKGGIEFPVLVNFNLRCGYATGSDEFSAGAGYKKNKLAVDMAFTRHPLLGFSPQLSVGYEF